MSSYYKLKNIILNLLSGELTLCAPHQMNYNEPTIKVSSDDEVKW